MYYKIYEIFSASGYNGQVGTAQTLKDAILRAKNDVPHSRFAYAITEHLNASKPAVAIYSGDCGKDPKAVRSLITYAPDPTQGYKAGGDHWTNFVPPRSSGKGLGSPKKKSSEVLRYYAKEMQENL